MCECEICSLEPEERARNDARRGAALLLLQQFLASAQAGEHLTEVLNKAIGSYIANLEQCFCLIQFLADRCNPVQQSLAVIPALLEMEVEFERMLPKYLSCCHHLHTQTRLLQLDWACPPGLRLPLQNRFGEQFMEGIKNTALAKAALHGSYTVESCYKIMCV